MNAKRTWATWTALMTTMAAVAATIAVGPTPVAWTQEQPGAAAEEGVAGKLSAAVERVVAFKDGYGLVIKAAKGIAAADGTVFTEDIPSEAVLGCMWATMDGSATAVPVRAEWSETVETRTREVTCVSLVEILRANAGKTVQLYFKRADTAPIRGTIVSVLERMPEALTEEKLLEIARQSSNREIVIQRGAAGSEYVVVDHYNAQVPDAQPDKPYRSVWPIGEIRAVESASADVPLETQTTVEEYVMRRAKRLTFTVGRDKAGQEVALKFVYFTPGVRWIPTYRVSGKLENDAHVALQADIINDVETMRGATIDLVIGVPNFRFKDTRSPLTLEVMMRASVQHVPAMRGREFSNAMMTQQMHGGPHEGPVASDGTMEMAPELATGAAHDLFVYTVTDFTLAKSGRATVPLWQSTVPMRHLYTMDVKVVRNSATGQAWVADSGARSPLQLATNRVWHQLELTNNTQTPWTTGAALMLRDHIPLGQELLTYTSVGGKAELPVTVAVDMRGHFEEEELSRQPNAMRWANYDYARIRKKGTITITNFRRETSTTRIVISLGGRAENASAGGTIRLNDFQPADWSDSHNAQVNNHSDVMWNLELKPGETRTLTVDFSYFVR